jgi:hypothetical protein
MIHIAADLSIFELALLGVGGMIVFAVWVYAICKCVELFTKD